MTVWCFHKKKKRRETAISCLLKTQGFIQQPHCEIWCNTGFIWRDVTVGGNDPLSFICIQVNLISTAQGAMHWKPTTESPKKGHHKINGAVWLTGHVGPKAVLKIWRTAARQQACSQYIYFSPKTEKMQSLQVILYVLLHHQHVSMVTMCPVMEICPRIWIFPHTSIYCAYTLFHFLTSTFFFSHTETRFPLLQISRLSAVLFLSLPHTTFSRSAYHPLSVSL